MCFDASNQACGDIKTIEPHLFQSLIKSSLHYLKLCNLPILLEKPIKDTSKHTFIYGHP